MMCIAVDATMMRVEPTGDVVVVNPTTSRPIFVVRAGALIIQAGHGRDKMFFSVPLASLWLLLSAMDSARASRDTWLSGQAFARADAG